MAVTTLLPLPIDDVLPQIVEALRSGRNAVLRAPTGAGKTTRVPPALLAAGVAGLGQILLLQPRRLAARAAAWRMAEERGTPLGEEIGYQVRFERRASRRTRILALTEGLLVRMLHDDPLLEHVGVIIFDEFHERTLAADLSLAIARRLQRDVRPDLKLLVMSATLDPVPIAGFLGDCPTIESIGRLHPVAISYLRHDDRAPIHVQVAGGVRQIIAETAGDVLAFLPGVGEIRRTARELESLAADGGLVVTELFGDLPLERQQAVLQPSQRRKIVLATNVAETSVTIPGVTGVVDSGLARINRVDPALGINRLDICRISRASADQRAGRAGRTAPGVCLRLWTEQTHRALTEHDSPEIERADLAGALIELQCWDERAAADFNWFEPPSAERLEQARRLLRQLGAIDDRGLTRLSATGWAVCRPSRGSPAYSAKSKTSAMPSGSRSLARCFPNAIHWPALRRQTWSIARIRTCSIASRHSKSSSEREGRKLRSAHLTPYGPLDSSFRPAINCCANVVPTNYWVPLLARPAVKQASVLQVLHCWTSQQWHRIANF